MIDDHCLFRHVRREKRTSSRQQFRTACTISRVHVELATLDLRQDLANAARGGAIEFADPEGFRGPAEVLLIDKTTGIANGRRDDSPQFVTISRDRNFQGVPDL